MKIIINNLTSFNSSTAVKVFSKVNCLNIDCLVNHVWGVHGISGISTKGPSAEVLNTKCGHAYCKWRHAFL